MNTFPLLELPKDLLQLLVHYLDSHYDKRNYMITCKKVYNSVPAYLRKEHLFDLSVIHRYSNMMVQLSAGKGKMFCTECRTYYKRKHKMCHGLVQCSRCWGHFRIFSHTRACKSTKHRFFSMDRPKVAADFWEK